jgi:dihydroorotate dehydrogenase (NAD+) catalytic subunit
MVDVQVRLGPLQLDTPLIGACGTVGSVVDFATVSALEAYGAAVAKSVSRQPWPRRSAPRLAPVPTGMLNAIGIQNPGIDEWLESHADEIATLAVPVWGSAVGNSADDFAIVAAGLARSSVAAIEVNLSCPNLEDGSMFALDPDASRAVVASVRKETSLPVGAKLSPNATDIVAVASAVMSAGADFVVLTNTVWGAGIDVETRRPRLSSVVGGYSGRGIKPIALRCVWEVHQALPEVPIVGCGGVRSGDDVVEYLLAGASAVALGSVHFEAPRAGRRVLKEVEDYCRRHEVTNLAELTGGAIPWGK